MCAVESEEVNLGTEGGGAILMGIEIRYGNFGI